MSKSKFPDCSKELKVADHSKLGVSFSTRVSLSHSKDSSPVQNIYQFKTKFIIKDSFCNITHDGPNNQPRANFALLSQAAPDTNRSIGVSHLVSTIRRAPSATDKSVYTTGQYTNNSRISQIESPKMKEDFIDLEPGNPELIRCSTTVPVQEPYERDDVGIKELVGMNIKASIPIDYERYRKMVTGNPKAERSPSLLKRPTQGSRSPSKGDMKNVRFAPNIILIEY